VPTPDDVWKSSELDSMPDPTRPGDVLFRNNDGTYEAIPFDEATDREDDDLGEWITPGTLIEKPGPRKAQLREWSDQRLKWAQQEDQSYLNSDLGYPAVRTQKQKNVNDINMELARREGKDVGDFDAPAPVKKAPAKKAPAKKASAKAAPPKLTDPDVKQLLADTEANFREDGVDDYTPESLMSTRSSQLAEEIRYAVENGDNWITLKVPSGSEQSIPLKLAQAYASSKGISYI